MLRDIFVKDYKHRDNLSQSTARALTLGNDITAYGHNIQFVEDTIRTYTGVPALTSKTAVYPAEKLLVRIMEQNNNKLICKDGICEATYKPRLSDRFINTLQNRLTFWTNYKKLRALGYSRKAILDIIHNKA